MIAYCPICRHPVLFEGEQGSPKSAFYVLRYRCLKCKSTVTEETSVEFDADLDAMGKSEGTK